MTLPHTFGITLSGQPRQFPADLPETPVALVFGFAHEARHDVARWKRELEAHALPHLSLPATVDDVPAHALAGIAEAMKAHVPAEAWDGIVQIHRGAGTLMEVLGWRRDLHAKVLVTDRGGGILASHGSGAFCDEAFRMVARALTRGPGGPPPRV
ncbi:MAG: hypothetical protein U0P81_07865 [Holophagaceae bacterium]